MSLAPKLGLVYILALTNNELKQMVKKLVKGEVAVTNIDLRVDWSTVKSLLVRATLGVPKYNSLLLPSSFFNLFFR